MGLEGFKEPETVVLLENIADGLQGRFNAVGLVGSRGKLHAQPFPGEIGDAVRGFADGFFYATGECTEKVHGFLKGSPCFNNIINSENTPLHLTKERSPVTNTENDQGW
jgi:hypothetical protein